MGPRGPKCWEPKGDHGNAAEAQKLAEGLHLRQPASSLAGTCYWGLLGWTPTDYSVDPGVEQLLEIVSQCRFVAMRCYVATHRYGTIHSYVTDSCCIGASRMSLALEMPPITRASNSKTADPNNPYAFVSCLTMFEHVCMLIVLIGL